MVFNGVFHRTRAGRAWQGLSLWYGSWKTVYDRHRHWSLDGAWEEILEALGSGPLCGRGLAEVVLDLATDSTGLAPVE
jgi:Putative transposase of IS4/5 family (DUF4096)